MPKTRNPNFRLLCVLWIKQRTRLDALFATNSEGREKEASEVWKHRLIETGEGVDDDRVLTGVHGQSSILGEGVDCLCNKKGYGLDSGMKKGRNIL
ncbi:hypothetical protein K1719_030950 [Acacia pycnantha]|nr:hypothetical protein K1719_030950 [Acacia pycnantha]